MAEAQNQRFLELKISNKTRDMTLKYHGAWDHLQGLGSSPGSGIFILGWDHLQGLASSPGLGSSPGIWDHLQRGQESPQLTPELPPGSSDSCDVFTAPDALGIEQVLVYEAESFTLAIAFHVYRLSHVPLSMLQVELSLDKSHLDDLEGTLRRVNRLLDAPDPERTAVSRGVASSRTVGGVQLNAGPYRLSALVEHEPTSVLEIQLAERRPLAPASDDGEPSPCKIL